MKKRWPASAALLYLVVGTLIAYLIGDIAVALKHNHYYKEITISSNIQVVKTCEQYQAQIMANAKSLLETLASLPIIHKGKPAEITKFFKVIENNQPNFSSFNIFTPDGKTLVSIHRGRNIGHASPEIIRQRQYFKNALATKSFTVGMYLTTSGLSHMDNLPVAIPVYDEHNKAKYVIMVTLDLKKITQYYVQLAKDANKSIQIYDGDRTLIFTTNENSQHRIGSTDKLEYITNIINSDNTLLWQKTIYAEEKEQITSLATIKLNNMEKPYLYFIVNSSLLSPYDLIIKYHMLEIYALFFGLFVSSILAAWINHYYFNQGLEQLTHVATSAQNGNISARNGYIMGCRELQVLGKAFDSMLTNLVSSSTHMQEQKARLDFALNGAQVATWEWDTLSKKYLLDRRGISLLGYNNYPESFIDLGTIMQKYDLQQAQITMELHVQDKIPNFEYEVKLIHQNGAQVWFVLQGRKEITTLTSDVQRIFGICIDITQRKKLERFEIERAEYFKRLSHKDALTGLSNRRHFIEQAQIMIQHSLRHGHSFSLAMLDLDFFKKINDTHGHLAGDNVLKTLAELLTNTIRKTDIVGRYGGEEFILLLPETSQDKAISTAEKLRKSIMTIAIPSDDEDITFTASIGICTFEPKSTVLSTNEQVSSIIVDLTSCADANLYKAKEAGRNKVVSTIFGDIEPKINS